jgi:hypothetical protein
MGEQRRKADATINGVAPCCGNCRSFDPSRRLCRFNPPMGVVVGMQPHPLDPSKQAPIAISVYPPVVSQEWCRQHEMAEVRQIPAISAEALQQALSDTDPKGNA